MFVTMISTLEKNLKALMFNHGIKAVDLSKKTKVPQANIHRILSGESKNPHNSSIEPIAIFFSISLEQLTGKKEIPWLRSISEPTACNRVPVYSLKKVTLKNTKPEAFTVFDRAEVNASLKSFAVELTDTSMAPVFPKGTIIIVDPLKPVKNGCYALAQTQGSDEAIFRQVISDGQKFFLRSLNSDTICSPIKPFALQDKWHGVLVQAKVNYG